MPFKQRCFHAPHQRASHTATLKLRSNKAGEHAAGGRIGHRETRGDPVDICDPQARRGAHGLSHRFFGDAEFGELLERQMVLGDTGADLEHRVDIGLAGDPDPNPPAEGALVAVEDVSVRLADPAGAAKASPQRDPRRSRVLRLHLDHRNGGIQLCRIAAHQVDRAGGQAAPAPGRVEAVGDVDLAEGQSLTGKSQFDRPRRNLLRPHSDREGPQWSAGSPLVTAVFEVRRRAVLGHHPAAEPARCQLVLAGDVRTHLIGTKRRERDRAIR